MRDSILKILPSRNFSSPHAIYFPFCVYMMKSMLYELSVETFHGYPDSRTSQNSKWKHEKYEKSWKDKRKSRNGFDNDLDRHHDDGGS